MDVNIILESFYYLSKQLQSPIDKLAAIKLLFFADRYHLRKYGRLISDDTYYALPHGPVASNALNIINEIISGNSVGVEKTYLIKTENIRNSFTATSDEYELEYLSDSDTEALDFVIENFGKNEARTLRDLTHQYPEWKRYKNTLENHLSRRELIVMNDFFEHSSLIDDPYNIISNRTVELSKEFYLNY